MKKRILLVEHNQWARNMIVNGLKLFGYQFIECNNEQQAQQILFKSNQNISLAIVELQSKTTYGYELIHQIRLQTNIPIIVQPEMKKKEIILKCNNLGINNILCKPIRLLSLKQKIFELLESRQNQEDILDQVSSEVYANSTVRMSQG